MNPIDDGSSRRISILYDHPSSRQAAPNQRGAPAPSAGPAQQNATQPTAEQLAEHLGWDPAHATKALTELGLDGEGSVKALGFVKQDRDASTRAWKAEVRRWSAETQRTSTKEDL